MSSVISKVIAATNRADILDPALMRSGRLDRKIEFPHPTEEARARILQVCLPQGFLSFEYKFIYSGTLNVSHICHKKPLLLLLFLSVVFFAASYYRSTPER